MEIKMVPVSYTHLAAQQLLYAGVHLGDKVACLLAPYVCGEFTVAKEQPSLAHCDMCIRDRSVHRQNRYRR